MGYKEKYEMALERARIWKDKSGMPKDKQGILDDIFPELKESEDERVRQRFIKLVKMSSEVGGFALHKWEAEEMLAWLEKKGEIENINNDDLATLEIWEDIIKENKEKWQLSDWFIEATSLLIQKVKCIENNHKSKFNIGDGLEKQGEQKPTDTDNKFIRMRETKPKDISEFLDRLTTVEQEFLWEHIAKIRELDKEEQKPVNDTDEEIVKAVKDTSILDMVEPKFNIGDTIKYVGERKELAADKYTIKEICNNCYITTCGSKIPFRMQEYYVIVNDTKGLKKIENEHICELDNSYTCVKFPFKAKVKSSGTIVTINNGQLSSDGKEWIKYQSGAEDGYKIYKPNNLELVCEIEQNSAWNEEDEDMLKSCLRILYARNDTETMCTKWLKSLKARCTWKPSDKQIRALRWVLNNIPYNTHKEEISGLLDQIKDL